MKDVGFWDRSPGFDDRTGRFNGHIVSWIPGASRMVDVNISQASILMGAVPVDDAEWPLNAPISLQVGQGVDIRGLKPATERGNRIIAYSFRPGDAALVNSERVIRAGIRDELAHAAYLIATECIRLIRVERTAGGLHQFDSADLAELIRREEELRQEPEIPNFEALWTQVFAGQFWL